MKGISLPHSIYLSIYISFHLPMHLSFCIFIPSRTHTASSKLISDISQVCIAGRVLKAWEIQSRRAITVPQSKGITWAEQCTGKSPEQNGWHSRLFPPLRRSWFASSPLCLLLYLPRFLLFIYTTEIRISSR